MNDSKRTPIVERLLFAIALAGMLLPGKAEAQWQARHALTPAQFQATFDTLGKQGYRLKCMSGYMSGGERYAALWVKAPGPAWQARNGLSPADYQKTFDDLVKQGYRLTWVSAHEAGLALHYEAIWEKREGPPWEAHHNMTAAQYQQTFDSLTKQGYRPVHVSGYSAGGSARYAAIFEKSNAPAWQARHAMTAAQFQQTFDDFSKQGYRLKDLSGYNVGGTDFYAAIWKKETGPAWWARNGVPDAWYQNVFDNFYYQGYTPLLLTAFTSGGHGKMNGIWTNTSFSAKDLDLINTQMNDYLSANQAPGAAIAITKDGRLVYAAGFGHANQETGEETGPTSLFRIASVSKPFTSVAIMKLVEAGKLNLDDKVFGPKLLGAQFPVPASNKKIEQITVRYLLEHVSGLSNAGGDPMFMNLGMTHAQLISWVLNDPAHVMSRNANSQFEYLNFGFCLLGRVIEKVSGKGYEQFVKETVLGPSGITNMVIGANSESQAKPREVKYYPAADAYSLNVTRFDSHGGWVASPIDLERFLVRVDGLPTRPDILSAGSHTAMTTAAHEG